MASSSRQPCTTSDNPHFFKIVLSNALNEKKLEIPKLFVKEHGLKVFLNNQTCLKVADGREWNVGLTKSNGRVWFHHGWQQFVEFYSVGFGYFLVFKYEGGQSSSFHVVIFNLTATEIKYPAKKIRLDEAEVKVKMETSLDDIMETSLADLDLGFYSKDFKVGGDSLGAIKAMKGKHAGRKPPSKSSQQARAIAKATAFQSTTLNPSFMCKMSHSHIHPGKSVHVPKSFAEMHLEEPTEIILEVSDGRMWEAFIGFYCAHRMYWKVDLRNGWKKFAGDNNLKVGDACVFEMFRKNSTRISFKVEIFRAS